MVWELVVEELVVEEMAIGELAARVLRPVLFRKSLRQGYQG
jgi:hypothetical protein